MVDRLLGHWKCVQNENLDEFFKANNINYLLRKVGNSIASYEEILKDGDQWTIHIRSTFKSSEATFKLNEPFTQKRLDGREVTAVCSVEGNKLISHQTPISAGDLPCEYTREVLEDGRMLLTCRNIPKNVVAKRYYVHYQP